MQLACLHKEKLSLFAHLENLHSYMLFIVSILFSDAEVILCPKRKILLRRHDLQNVPVDIDIPAVEKNI